MLVNYQERPPPPPNKMKCNQTSPSKKKDGWFRECALCLCLHEVNSRSTSTWNQNLVSVINRSRSRAIRSSMVAVIQSSCSELGSTLFLSYSNFVSRLSIRCIAVSIRSMYSQLVLNSISWSEPINLRYRRKSMWPGITWPIQSK